MPRFAANLTMMFTEVAFLDRFAAAARVGFAGVEFLFPYAFAPDAVAAAAREAGVDVVLFNLPPGDWDRGERGLAALPGREDEFRASVVTAIGYAQTLGVPRLHAMAGIVGPDVDHATCRAAYVDNLGFAARALAGAGLDLLIEPINRRDMPGYFLDSFEAARGIVAQVGAPNLKVQADLYHMQIARGDLTRRIEAGIADIGHVQVAGVPDRHEPDTGEVDFRHLFALLDRLGYAGWIGCEYRPAGRTEDGLGWMRR